MMIQIPQDVAAKLAGTFRGTPALLAILLVNTLFLAAIVWSLWTSHEYRYKERMELIRVIERCAIQQGSS